MGLALLDSSAVIGYLDADDLLHADACTAIEETMRGGSALAVSAITWAELLHGASLGYRDETIVREFGADFGLDVLSVDAAVAERAAGLQAAHASAGSGRRLRTPDALILASADVDPEVELVMCADEKWLRVSGLETPVRLIRER